MQDRATSGPFDDQVFSQDVNDIGIVKASRRVDGFQHVAGSRDHADEQTIDTVVNDCVAGNVWADSGVIRCKRVTGLKERISKTSFGKRVRRCRDRRVGAIADSRIDDRCTCRCHVDRRDDHL